MSIGDISTPDLYDPATGKTIAEPSTHPASVQISEDNSEAQTVCLSKHLPSQTSPTSINSAAAAESNVNPSMGNVIPSLGNNITDQALSCDTAADKMEDAEIENSDDGHGACSRSLKSKDKSPTVADVQSVSPKQLCNGIEENESGTASLTNSRHSSPGKSVPKARKTLTNRQTSRKSGSKQPPASISLGLRQIEASLGIKARSLAELDARTLDKLIFDRAVRKAKSKQSKLHQPKIDGKQGVHFLKMKNDEKCNNETCDETSDGGETIVTSPTACEENDKCEPPTPEGGNTLCEPTDSCAQLPETNNVAIQNASPRKGRKGYRKGVIRVVRPAKAKSKRQRRLMKLEKLHKQLEIDAVVLNEESQQKTCNNHGISSANCDNGDAGTLPSSLKPVVNGVLKTRNAKRIVSTRRKMSSLNSGLKRASLVSKSKADNKDDPNNAKTNLLQYFSLDNNSTKNGGKECVENGRGSLEAECVFDFPGSDDNECKTNDTGIKTGVVDKSIDDISGNVSTDCTVDFEGKVTPQSKRRYKRKRRRNQCIKNLNSHKNKIVSNGNHELPTVSTFIVYIEVFSYYLYQRLLN